MSESGTLQDISSNSISSMLESIKVSMEHLEDEVSAMAETLESLSANISGGTI